MKVNSVKCCDFVSKFIISVRVDHFLITLPERQKTKIRHCSVHLVREETCDYS
jgi:hypothetical protein